jgi:hypothetical protein
MADYATAQEVSDHLIDADLMDGDVYQGLLEALVTRASRLIDNWFGWPENFYVSGAAAARYFDGNGEQEFWPGHMAAAPTEVAVAEVGDITNYTVWTATDYIVYPLNAAAEGRPFRSLMIDLINGTKTIWYKYPKSVKITAQWGWSIAAPEPITEACIVQTARWFRRGQQQFQDAGAVTELMQMRYLKKLDPEVELLLTKMPGGITI